MCVTKVEEALLNLMPTRRSTYMRDFKWTTRVCCHTSLKTASRTFLVGTFLVGTVGGQLQDNHVICHVVGWNNDRDDPLIADRPLSELNLLCILNYIHFLAYYLFKADCFESVKDLLIPANDTI